MALLVEERQRKAIKSLTTMLMNIAIFLKVMDVCSRNEGLLLVYKLNFLCYIFNRQKITKISERIL